MTRIKEALRELKILFQLSWQKKGRRNFFIVLFAIGIFLTGLTIWRWISPVSVAGYPEIAYSEFKERIAAENVQWFSLKYIDENDAVTEYRSGLAAIFVRLKNGEIFATQELRINKVSAINFMSYVREAKIDYLVVKYKQYQVGVFPSVSFSIFGELKTGDIFITDPGSSLKTDDLFGLFLEKSIPSYEIILTTINQEIQSPQLAFFERKKSSTIFTASYWTVSIFLILIIISRAKKSAAGVYVNGEARGGGFLSDSLGPKVTFEDVAGVDESKQELEEVLKFLKHPDRFFKMGAKMPKGLLLVGPPGTGKTLLARALAFEAKVPFKSVAASEFVEKYVGVGARNIRNLFDEARAMVKAKKTAFILFIDEIDALGKRVSGGGDNPEYHQTLTQFLTEMDGFKLNEKILVIAATNQPEAVDPAILRPGRFDRQIILPWPDLEGRKAILKVHVRNKPLAPEVNLDKIAQMTPLGFSGADIANVANEAAIRAALLDKEKIEEEDFEKAVDKFLVGGERKSMLMAEDDKQIAAHHETGHVLIAKFNPGVGLPKKVSIIPTMKGAGGYTKLLHEKEKSMFIREDLLAQIQELLGGRIAEEIIFGKEKVSTGAVDDLKRATKIAEQMVCDFAMADEEAGLALRTYGERQELHYLGGLSRQRDYSEEDAQKISKAVNLLIIKCSQKAKNILETNRDILEKIASALKTKEILDINEIDTIFKETISKRSL